MAETRSTSLGFCLAVFADEQRVKIIKFCIKTP
jgi:hypothetical protein